MDTNAEGFSQEKKQIILILLAAVYVTCMVTTTLLAYIPTNILFFIEPGGIYTFSFTFIIASILCETYGRNISRAVVCMGIVCEIIFVGSSMAVLHLFPHPEFWKSYEIYSEVLNPTVRFLFATLLGITLGELANVYGLWRWKVKLRGQAFMLRAVAWAAIGQFVVSFVNDMLLYFNKYPFMSIINMVFSGFLFKMIFCVAFLFPSWLLVQYLKKNGVDAYAKINTTSTLFGFARKLRNSLASKHLQSG